MTNARSKPRSVPQSRLARSAALGGTTTRILGNLAVGGLGELARGRRPEFRDLLLTPNNVQRLTDQLARMRGAAMKLGQLISMDGGDVLPPELVDILARLRAEADFMPAKQLKSVLNSGWGEGWLRQFKHFDVRPIAAASIGQVHRAVTRDGHELAIKVQYPGVRRSIDSDVDAVGQLVCVSGLLPPNLDLKALLEEAKIQLHQEADYLREAQALSTYRHHLGDDARFDIPALHADLTTDTILAMEFQNSQPLDVLESASQADRDRLMADLLDLTLKELFEFRFMQTDPNFANYRYHPEASRIVLLDFGAARPVPNWVSDGYKALLVAGLNGDAAGVEAHSLDLGFLPKDASEAERAEILGMIGFSFEMLAQPRLFDFGDPAPAQEMRRRGYDLAQDMTHIHIPPIETLFVQRKFAGMYLLARRLGSRVDLGALLNRYI
ncbi:MAG: AarF/ABC1/UbiB kinase family protein [Pseudomonadota bacterium]